jgi:hypothetical protein
MSIMPLPLEKKFLAEAGSRKRGFVLSGLTYQSPIVLASEVDNMQ